MEERKGVKRDVLRALAIQKEEATALEVDVLQGSVNENR